MKNTLLCLAMLLCTSLFAEEDLSQLVTVFDKQEDLTEFRSLSGPYLQDKTLSTTRGLDNIKTSGSAQFSERGLEELQKKLNQKDLVIIDLREEPHGFINGAPVSWMYKDGRWPDKNLSYDKIEEQEKELLKNALKEVHITIYRIFKNRDEEDEIFHDEFIPVATTVKNVTTESNLCAKMGLGYVRVPITDHDAPTDSNVNTFMIFYKARPEGSWTHVHCRGGRGRTSTVLIMIDMIHNAKKLTFDQIMEREIIINDINLLTPSSILAKKFNKGFERRLNFLKEFYSYCRENNDEFATPWLDFVEKAKLKEVSTQNNQS